MMGRFVWEVCELMKMRNFPGHCEGHAKQKQQITASQRKRYVQVSLGSSHAHGHQLAKMSSNVVTYVLFPSGRCEPVWLPSTSSIADLTATLQENNSNLRELQLARSGAVLDRNVLIVSLDRHVVSVLAREVTNVTVLLPSGRSAELSVSKRSTVGDLKIAAQKAFQQGFLTLGV